MKKNICIVTATRAEYGLLRPIILKMRHMEEFDVQVVVTGAHLSPEFGLTYREIEKDGIKINKKIEILLNSDTEVAVSKAMGLAMIGFSEYFVQRKPDLLIVLGDRYEMLAVACAAMNAGIPIAHLYGGEITEGAVDDSIRHAITKLSYLHFTSTEIYRKRVIQLGEEPERVFTVGAIGIENALNLKLLSKAELENTLEWKLDRPLAVVTFHPVTLEKGEAVHQAQELLNALDRFPNMQFILTKANADVEGMQINKCFGNFVADHENFRLYDSLGVCCYLSALKQAEMVIGNSSSGLLEAPSFHIPTINIGNRQKGRLQAASVINCDTNADEIEAAMGKALSEQFKKVAACAENPYGDGTTSEKVVENIKQFLSVDEVNLKKNFYDIVF